jgi:hypothetical protein
VTEWIASVKAWIDRYAGRTFEAAATTKYYDGNGSDRIIVDSLVGTPTEVSILDSQGNVQQTLVLNTDYLLYPLNTTEKYEIRFIRALDWEYWEGFDEWPIFYKGDKRLKITASFGASTAIPADVELAATKLVAKIVENRLAGTTGSVKSESLGDYSVSFGDIDDQADALGVFNILDQWREPSI